MRRQLREAQAIEEIHESWVVGDETRAESIAEGLVKANEGVSLMGLERAEADAAADLARRDRSVDRGIGRVRANVPDRRLADPRDGS